MTPNPVESDQAREAAVAEQEGRDWDAIAIRPGDVVTLLTRGGIVVATVQRTEPELVLLPSSDAQGATELVRSARTSIEAADKPSCASSNLVDDELRDFRRELMGIALVGARSFEDVRERLAIIRSLGESVRAARASPALEAPEAIAEAAFGTCISGGVDLRPQDAVVLFWLLVSFAETGKIPLRRELDGGADDPFRGEAA